MAIPAVNLASQRPIGTGPHKFKEWVRGSHVIYERYQDYWDHPKPYIDQLVVRFITDLSERVAAFETRELDLGGYNRFL